jgi:16S rRNA processing protein RimM
MQLNDYYKIGYILKPHGLKGEVTVSIEADAGDVFDSVETVFVEQSKRLVPFFIESISQTGSKAYIKFEDIATVEAATAISKSALYLPKTARPKSARGEFYDDEIIGFEVTDKSLGSLGPVTDVEHAGPNKLLLVHYHDKEVLIPVNGPFIKSMNKTKRTISVELPDGFTEM